MSRYKLFLGGQFFVQAEVDLKSFLIFEQDKLWWHRFKNEQTHFMNILTAKEKNIIMTETFCGQLSKLTS